MFAPTWEVDEPVQRALAWASGRGIAVRPWPDPHGDDHALVHQPTLWVVTDGESPPVLDATQDWLRAPIDRDELYARADALLARARSLGPVRVSLDDDQVLRVDDTTLILSPTEADLAAILIARLGQVVGRDEVTRALWPGRGHRTDLLPKHVRSLRRRLHAVALDLHTVRGQGLLLERRPPAMAVP